MFIQRRFTFKAVLFWTRRDISFYLVISTYPVFFYYFLDWHWLSLPAMPITLIGTIVAFNIGFKNNNAYERLWEARKIYGGIVNTSRSWGIHTINYIGNQFATDKKSESELKAIHTNLIYRHLAWLTALRYQLRQERKWEHHLHKDQVQFKERYHTSDEHKNKLEEAIAPFLSEEERLNVLKRPNPAMHLIKNQSAELKKLRELGLIDDFRHVELNNLLNELYIHQGQAERIKNFPLPRQYATVSYIFVMIFIYVLPFSMMNAFENLAKLHGEAFIWLTVPASVMVSWVFFTLEKIGDYSENPFEGTGNDVPITSMSKGIEIDLRDMLDESDLPSPILPEYNILT